MTSSSSSSSSSSCLLLFNEWENWIEWLFDTWFELDYQIHFFLWYVFVEILLSADTMPAYLHIDYHHQFHLFRWFFFSIQHNHTHTHMMIDTSIEKIVKTWLCLASCVCVMINLFFLLQLGLYILAETLNKEFRFLYSEKS